MSDLMEMPEKVQPDIGSADRKRPKVNTTESIMSKRAMTDSEIDKVAKSNLDRYKAAPRETVRIPLSDQNKRDNVQTVILNGARFDIRKGVDVKVPKPIAHLLKLREKEMAKNRIADERRDRRFA